MKHIRSIRFWWKERTRATWFNCISINKIHVIFHILYFHLILSWVNAQLYTFGFNLFFQRGNMRQKWVSLAVILMVLFAGLLPTLGDASTSTSLSRVKICFKNCGQCKRMLGDYFDGRRCADHCISQKGRFIPDCHDIFSISAFLSKLDYWPPCFLSMWTIVTL